jgi:tRNA threonylcarbamoyladenosine biosynthesis protein TsaB
MPLFYCLVDSMTTFIAIDSSSEACSVTLVVENQRFTRTSNTPKSHAQHLLPFIDDVLVSAQIKPSNLDYVACCEGPGSFTGLRIGFGVAQGLAFGLQIPMVGVSSLLSMAHMSQKQYPSAERILSVLDARMGEVYWSVHQVDSSKLVAVVEPRLTPIAEVPTHLAKYVDHNNPLQWLVAGEGSRLLDLSVLPENRMANEQIAPNSESIADIAQALWTSGKWCPAEAFELVYLRNSVSWNKRQKIRT